MCNRQLRIDLARQQLSCLESAQEVACYPVSTGLNGPGESTDSGCTPRGKHRVRIKIGAGCPLNTVFVGRRPTGERYSELLAKKQPDRDWVLTRIIWLSGIESGFNRGGRVDTLRRYIYIHGTPDLEPMGVARSHGCIRMHNRDLIELFDWVETGMLVEIRE
ncbi:MAG: L,D-transpeptidase [Candidatus Thiodiazotropha lotti]|uniref:L,D-transpeptidase n=1 Tax=Candidatus Thiodiazotropha endoloripes TaxID=1818881 RepID=UPI00083D4111|nr:L,D-transpeptidase [Candidatus Thiodiazotropha endoloripes]MCG7901433.1 L,D-transpeptidase [Candidatus Thiodiazotropha weberae]MCG7990801.1 L,D-transpeptidase [Candidatus Thiodiazotropha lotti]MCG7913711.1 L,D-transpeptidase [Candidatus Thiodiazotropha weberae]MCG7999335.1 L,D-transpeptidase [Candidatus Thiodiazotropha lotti]MCW4182455.1 L,D-transpeptidase [Candidatus Thiodiazotropha weberae]